MKVYLLLKTEFGNQRYYPTDVKDNAAHIILQLMKAKSFTLEQVKLMKKAGWEIKIAQPEIEI